MPKATRDFYNDSGYIPSKQVAKKLLDRWKRFVINLINESTDEVESWSRGRRIKFVSKAERGIQKLFPLSFGEWVMGVQVTRDGMMYFSCSHGKEDQAPTSGRLTYAS